MAENAELDSLLADCNGTSTSDQSGPCSGEDVVTYHGYDYDIVEIGDQCWFAENARYLPEVSPSAEGSEDDGQPHAYVYDYQGNNITEAIATSSYEVFGALYNFPAVAQWTLCPTGWHVGNDENWKELESHLGMSAIELDWYFPNEGYERGQTEEVGAKLKALTWDGINPTGFNALNTGWRWTGVFSFPNTAAFWTSTQIDDQVSWARTLETGQSGIVRQPYYPHFAKSVRCVKD